MADVIEESMDYQSALVSIIVPVYKVERYLETCINSVINQTYKNWELILVDDGSPDRCPQICDEFAQNDDRVTVLHCNNGGLSRARNRALDCPPKGEYITFLDSDDYWREDYLEIMVGLCEKNCADMSQCSFVRGTETVFPVINEQVETKEFDNHSIFLKEKANVIVCGKLFRAGLFNGIRMPEGLYNEDDWTTWKLYYRSSRIVVTTDKLYYYSENPTSTMARIHKKPDMRYWGAYNERISFFIKTGERDLEHCSRAQLCKSLVLVYSNQHLTKQERTRVKSKFDESWRVLVSSPYVSMKFRVLFCLFHFMPLSFSKMAVILYERK